MRRVRAEGSQQTETLAADPPYRLEGGADGRVVSRASKKGTKGGTTLGALARLSAPADRKGRFLERGAVGKRDRSRMAAPCQHLGPSYQSRTPWRVRGHDTPLALLRALIHPSAWKWISRKFVCRNPNIRPTRPLNDPPRRTYMVHTRHAASSYLHELAHR
jgi:hypothetical protein